MNAYETKNLDKSQVIESIQSDYRQFAAQVVS